MNPPAKLSPAPVGSNTDSMGNAGAEKTPESENINAPYSPLFMMITPGPNDMIRRAIIVGSVMASFDVEDFSLNRLKKLTNTEIESRYNEFKQLTYFEDL